MTFPSPTITPPSLGAYGLSYNGTAFGGIVNPITGGPAGYATIAPNGVTGHDRAVVTSQDTQRNLDEGEWPGIDVLTGRDVLVQMNVISDGTSLQHALTALQACFANVGVTEYPFFLQMPNQSLRVCMARPRGFTYPVDINYVQAGLAVVSLRMHATDPRWYDTPTQALTIGLAAPGVGIGFPISFPVSFGGSSSGGALICDNYGNYEMRPLLVVTGPCTNPTIGNASIAGNPRLTFNVTLNAGDKLTIDTDAQSATLVTAGSPASSGASRLGTLAVGSTWWNLPPGGNTIQFSSSDPTQVAGTLTVEFADAWNAI